jgi:hypothetical protein
MSGSTFIAPVVAGVKVVVSLAYRGGGAIEIAIGRGIGRGIGLTWGGAGEEGRERLKILRKATHRISMRHKKSISRKARVVVRRQSRAAYINLSFGWLNNVYFRVH